MNADQTAKQFLFWPTSTAARPEQQNISKYSILFLPQKCKNEQKTKTSSKNDCKSRVVKNKDNIR